ncbi:gamma carbonic anhydrase family protein [Streptosporangium lutulentum]|uniref:Carbonic anhydrase/acetyltransferase-like protein (Isoleucine patch superfamily) n=1 Tax=Streptosporangium lutulentum TaxID=1461250 RepID=A0ABT9QNB9_9ACTN|nr:gamma carbonic anhydrase family protein [Streptosporangium lutulentum]MDP9848246.1 carbonic anhydrase/acetyltransferase-like protein (isoleucine patch superfamily) [Streptosporangium lutulentum]
MNDEPYIAALDGDAIPQIHPDAYVAPGATIVGRVRLGRAASVWYGAVVRGDNEAIEIAEECNVQDLCCLHTDPGEPVLLEQRVSLGHRAVVHGAHVEAGALVGIGAIVLNGARIGAGSLVAAGALVGPGKKIPAGVLVAGVPGRIVRELTDDDRASFARTSATYMAKAARHRAATTVPPA